MNRRVHRTIYLLLRATVLAVFCLAVPLAALAQEESDDGTGWELSWATEEVDGKEEVRIFGTASLPDGAEIDVELYVRDDDWRDVLKFFRTAVKDGKFEIRITPFDGPLWPSIYEVDLAWDPQFQPGRIKSHDTVRKAPWNNHRRKTLKEVVGDPTAQKEMYRVRFLGHAEQVRSALTRLGDCVSLAASGEVDKARTDWKTLIEDIPTSEFSLIEQRVLYGWDLPGIGLNDLRKQLQDVGNLLLADPDDGVDWSLREKQYKSFRPRFESQLTEFADYYNLGAVHRSEILVKLSIVATWLEKDTPPEQGVIAREMLFLQPMVPFLAYARLHDLSRDLTLWAANPGAETLNAAKGSLSALRAMIE